MKKHLLALFSALFLLSACDLLDPDEHVVELPRTLKYMGETIEFVQVGDQLWMKENLNVGSGEERCMVGLSRYCEKFGRLFFWEEALNACPAGSHLPSYEEWKKLTDFLYLNEKYVKYFTNQLGGYLDVDYWGNHISADIGNSVYFWSSTEIDLNDDDDKPALYGGTFQYSTQNGYKLSQIRKDVGLYIRCVMNEMPSN